MKIIHTSDIHLDSPLTTRLPGTQVRERRRELLSGFGRLVKEARTLGAEAIIIAGDLFDGERVSKRALDTTLDIIEYARDITFLYLQGNHDGNALALSGRAMPDNIRTFGDEWTYHRIGGVTFAGRNSITQNMFNELSLPHSTKNIVILHGELRDRCSAPESIGIKDAADRGIDYLALGHYHSYSSEAIDGRGTAVYCGTPEGRGFDEAGDKGYVVISADETVVTHSFKSFAGRKLHIAQLPLDGITKASDIMTQAAVTLKGIPSCDIVRLELVGRYSQNLWKDTDSLLREYQNKFYYFEIKDSSRIAINPEDYKHDMSLKGEFIRTVSADDSLDEETKERIIACGINALMGEDLFDN
ncbi:MAG: DNA repair exonuclease [Clostridia bacterium]|nr:DNA repair exonuclease [Clostridia bacterium]